MILEIWINELLGVNRSSLYDKTKPVAVETLDIIDRINKQYTKMSFYGVEGMTAHLKREGLLVGHNWIHCMIHLMWLMEAWRQSKARLDMPAPLGYSCAGMVKAVNDIEEDFRIGDRVACSGRRDCLTGYSRNIANLWRGHRANEKEIEYFITRQVSTEETQEYYVNALTVFNIIESLKSGKPIPVEDIR